MTSAFWAQGACWPGGHCLDQADLSHLDSVTNHLAPILTPWK